MPGEVKDLYLASDWEALQQLSLKLDLAKYNEKNLKSSADTLLKNALENKKIGDQEKCYIFCMRYMILVDSFRTKRIDAVKEHTKNYKILLEMAEELSNNLRKRYNEKSKKENPAVNPLPPQPSQPVRPTEATPKDITAGGEKGDVSYGATGYQFISCKQLFGWLNFHRPAVEVKESILIIDVRPAKDYESCHIKSDRSINYPEELIEKGKTANYFGSRINPSFKKLWDERKVVNRLVLVDWSSTRPDLQENSPLEVFKQVIDKWDPGEYLSGFYILDGGFELWSSTYPNVSTSSRVEVPRKEMADSLNIHDISFPNLSESPSDWSFNNIAIGIGGIAIENGNGGEPSPYRSSTKPPLVDRSSKAKAEVLYERNERDQRQIEKDIDQNKTMLSHLEHKLIGNQNQELLDEKKKLEEKYTELEEQHKVKKEENERLRQQIIELQQRERVAAARQAPKPRIPMTLKEEPTKVSDSASSSTTITTQLPDAEKTKERLSPQEGSANAFTNDDFSTEPLKQDGDDGEFIRDLKRSRSTPNIAQIPPQDWQRPPTYDRSTKPIQKSYGYGSTYRVYGSNRMAGLTGLKNLGNTCYMNSIVQCISNTTKLTEYFCYGRYQNDLNVNRSNPTGGQVAEKVALVIRELWSGEYRSTGCEDLKRVVGRHSDTFAGSSQQDSHEFLTFLMDWLHNDLCRTSRKKMVNPELLSGPKMAWAEYKKASDSYISDLFFAQQVSTVVCRKCKEKSVTYEEPTSNLTLQLPSDNNRCSLSACLRLYTSGESISGYRCESCDQTNDAIKKVDIWRLPQILVIHLKRFYSDGFYHKRQTLVDFPLNGLDMREFTSNTETTNTKYNLYAVSNHYGTLEGGHYTAFCRNNDRWYKFDDQDVTEISATYVKSPNAYILFYEQV